MSVPRIGRPQGEQDWKRLQYPSEAEFHRIAEQHPEQIYSEDAGDFKAYFALPPWIRLGWPSLALWARCKSNPKVAKARYEDLKATYPDRPGVKPEDQDFYRLMKFWPDCYGYPFREITITLEKDIITINKLQYSKGTHRVPAPVATELARMNKKSIDERLKAMMPKEHADQIITELKNTGALVPVGQIL